MDQCDHFQKFNSVRLIRTIPGSPTKVVSCHVVSNLFQWKNCTDRLPDDPNGRDTSSPMKTPGTRISRHVALVRSAPTTGGGRGGVGWTGGRSDGKNTPPIRQAG